MQKATEHRFHAFGSDAVGIDLPTKFNDPFDYTPHPLCMKAADEVRRHIRSHEEWRNELAAGKMFGVLVVRRPCDAKHNDRLRADDNRSAAEGEIGFLAAFSGNLAGTNDHDFFVPPVYDMLRPNDFFRREEAAISAINRRIAELENAPQLAEAVRRRVETEASANEAVARFRREMQSAKALRDERRRTTDDPVSLEALLNESRRQKAEYHKLKLHRRELIDEADREITRMNGEIEALKSERRRRSEALQIRLFRNFEMLDARGIKRDLYDIFASATQRIPPAGAGECAAPKLLQYAYIRHMRPVAMAEFWYGASPKGEIRRDGCFYPACNGKCRPILGHMLQGLDVEQHDMPTIPEPEIVYEDRWLAVIDKPAGMLSTAGKIGMQSVEEWARQRFADASRATAVHRLDMATSGLMVIAKDLDTYRNLQEQFRKRTVNKRYVALLDGETARDEGRIELPLRADILDRPRQTADSVHGKSAVTEYRVRERRGGTTLVELRPHTGRTHQLRVHAAHEKGLNAPIVGDALYGTASARLCLHAEYIAFDHPHTGERVSFERRAEFR